MDTSLFIAYYVFAASLALLADFDEYTPIRMMLALRAHKSCLRSYSTKQSKIIALNNILSRSLCVPQSRCANEDSNWALQTI